jgi:hypothetical protein
MRDLLAPSVVMRIADELEAQGPGFVFDSMRK